MFALPEAHFNLGITTRALGRPAEALPHLELALLSGMDGPRTQRELGLALQALGREAEAQAYLRRAAELEGR